MNRDHAFSELETGLETERMLIRTPRPEDAPALWAAIDESREHLGPWIHWVKHYQTPRDADRFIEGAAMDFAGRRELFLAMFSRDEPGRLLGGTGFHNIEWEIPALEIGYWLRASAAGRGYMTEAVAAQCAFAVDRFGAKRISITCDANNVRSAAIPRRLGFAQEGHLRNAGLTPHGQIRDTLIFAVTSWPPLPISPLPMGEGRLGEGVSGGFRGWE